MRIDGRAFRTFTRGFRKPFDPILMESMQLTMKYLCENIQGCVLGYTQSDEISLLLIDYKTFESQPWFDNIVQKIASISASMATLKFNKEFLDAVNVFYKNWHISDEDNKYSKALLRAKDKGAMFDARCFNIPKEEVTNYFLWRQNDATRNSIEMVGRVYFSDKQLHEKTCSMIQDMLHEQKGVNWNDFSVPEKRGTCCIKTDEGWIIDKNIPIFKGEGREYIEKFVNVGE